MFNGGGDFRLMVGKIAQGVKNLREGEVGQVSGNILRGDAQTPGLDDGTDRRARAFDDGFTGKNLIVADDVEMFGGYGHGVYLIGYDSRRNTQDQTDLALRLSMQYQSVRGRRGIVRG